MLCRTKLKTLIKCKTTRLFARNISVKCKKLVVEDYGDPVEAVKIVSEEINDPLPHQVSLYKFQRAIIFIYN